MDILYQYRDASPFTRRTMTVASHISCAITTSSRPRRVRTFEPPQQQHCHWETTTLQQRQLWHGKKACAQICRGTTTTCRILSLLRLLLLTPLFAVMSVAGSRTTTTNAFTTAGDYQSSSLLGPTTTTKIIREIFGSVSTSSTSNSGSKRLGRTGAWQRSKHNVEKYNFAATRLFFARQQQQRGDDPCPYGPRPAFLIPSTLFVRDSLIDVDHDVYKRHRRPAGQKDCCIFHKSHNHGTMALSMQKKTENDQVDRRSSPYTRIDDGSPVGVAIVVLGLIVTRVVGGGSDDSSSSSIQQQLPDNWVPIVFVTASLAAGIERLIKNRVK